MSHNPNTVKSQDDTDEDELGRTMTLLRAIEQLEKTECELEKVEKQLDIAVKALEEIEKNGTNPDIKTITVLCVNNFLLAHKARIEIEELNK